MSVKYPPEVYTKAFAEVWEILQWVEDDDIAKIPTNVLNVFEKYRDPDYEYYVDMDKPLSEWEMLPETRAVLYNIYRDYWAAPEEREAILKRQDMERKQLKIERYSKMLEDEEGD
ncbi:MAG: hypothetical protein NC489_10720 [Ruminococcus flavefaciens]|nr:hypothetical protein [Ruminococcus flavefaciens]